MIDKNNGVGNSDIKNYSEIPILNVFQNRTEVRIENAKFPNWDIVPPNQIINPRIKPRK